jgi:hypothetical protein
MLKAKGFTRRTSRRFARERNNVFQQLWVDANGVGGKRRTLIVLCANLPFGPISGYLDPHGFRICSGRMWRSDTAELAEKSMLQVVEALQTSELAKLDAISNVQSMVEALKPLTGRSWYAIYSELHRKWLEKEREVLALQDSNRQDLGLTSN